MTVPMEILWRKGNWCAELKGHSDDKFRVKREFQNGQTVRARGGVVKLDLHPGWYEVSERGERRYFSVDTLHAAPISDTAFGDDLAGALAAVSAGPTPGEPGAWGSDKCECGAEVAHYDGIGFPYCAEHYVAPDLPEVMAQPDTEPF